MQSWLAEQCRFEFVRFVLFEMNTNRTMVCSVRVRLEQNRTRVSVFGATSEQNRTMPLFGSVRCGTELEQTEQDLGMFCSVLFVQLAISDSMTVWCCGEPPYEPKGRDILPN